MPPRIPKTLRVHGLDFDVWQLGDGRVSFSYTLGGVYRVVKRRTIDELRKEAERIALAIVNAETAACDLSADERRDAALALDQLARKIPERADRPTFVDLAKFWLERNPALGSAPPTHEIVDALILGRRKKGCSEVHCSRLKSDLLRFAAAVPELHKADERTINVWLDSELNRGISRRRRDNLLNAIVQLSRFARKEGWLADRQTPAERIERIGEGVSEVTTFTPAEMSAILRAASDRWFPFFAIGAFAGLRNSEILRLEWSAFHWQKNIIAVPAKIARKVRISRHAPLLPNLAELLSWCREKHGPVIPTKNERAALSELGREIERIRTKTSLRWKKNAPRHSFGSYRFAVLKDPEALRIEMGNSPEQIREHYNDPKTEDEARAWFSIGREEAFNVVNLPLRFGA